MSNILTGIICGILFGAFSVIIMIPMKFEDKKSAMLGSFFNRFAIGFMIAVAVMPLGGLLKGVIIGFLLSLPEAIITKAYGPIIGLGVIGGAVIGWMVG
jgi:hypothetical protein